MKFGHETVLKYIAYPFTAGKKTAKYIFAAMLSTINFFLNNLGFYVHDLDRIKEALIKGIEVETDVKVINAIKEANKISLAKRNQAIIEIEKIANAEKTLAETEKIKSQINLTDAQLLLKKKEKGKMESYERFANALQNLHEKGGAFYVSKNQLEAMLKRRIPPTTDSNGTTEEE